MPETPAPAVRPARPRPARSHTPLRLAVLLAPLLMGPLAACDAIYDDTKGWANRLEASIVGKPAGDPAPEAAPAPVAAPERTAPPAVPVEPVAVVALPAPMAQARPPAEPQGAMADASSALLAAGPETPAAPAEPAPAEPSSADTAAAALPPMPKPKPTTPAKADDEALVAAVLHLSSLRSEEAAKREWSDLQHSFPEPLGGLQAQFHRTELGDKGTFYRVLAGPLPSRDAAAEVCAALKAKDARQYCRVLPSKPKA